MSFIFGGNTGTTYSDVQRQRALAKQLLAGSNGTPRTAIEGANMGLDRIVSSIHDKRAGKAESAGREAFGSELAGLFGDGTPDVQALMGLAGNPYATSGQQQVVSALLGQALTPEDPMDAIQLEKAQMELEALRNPPEPERKTAKDANGRLRYLDTGEFAFDLGDAGETPRDMEAEEKLRKEFSGLQAVKDFSLQSAAMARIKASASNPSPAGDLALIFNYMKVLDPGSVVRESEFATAASSGSFGERIKAAVAQVQSGERLSDEMRADFVSRAGELYTQAENLHNNLYDQYSVRASDYGFEPEAVLNDFRYRETGAPVINKGRPKAAPGRPKPAPKPTLEEIQAERARRQQTPAMPGEASNAPPDANKAMGMLKTLSDEALQALMLQVMKAVGSN